MKKLKSFNKIGAENLTGQVIIPPIYNDIDRIDKYLGYDKDGNVDTISEPVYLAYQKPYYHLYTEQGKVDCPFNIKYFCVKNSTLIGLMDSDGYWHITAICPSTRELKVLFENLENIESYSYDHVVCRQTNDNQFVYSLKRNEIIYAPVYCKEISLYSEGYFVKKTSSSDMCSYDGKINSFEKVELSVIPGITVDSHEIILAKNTSNHLLGLYSFQGQCILPYHYIDINFNKHYLQRKEYITIDLHDLDGTRILMHLDSKLKLHSIYSNYSSIEFFDCGRIAIIHTATYDYLGNLLLDGKDFIFSKLLKSDEIERLYDYSCEHFILWQKKRCGVCDLTGNLVVPIKYRRVVSDPFNYEVYAYNLFNIKRTYYL